MPPNLGKWLQHKANLLCRHPNLCEQRTTLSEWIHIEALARTRTLAWRDWSSLWTRHVGVPDGIEPALSPPVDQSSRRLDISTPGLSRVSSLKSLARNASNWRSDHIANGANLRMKSAWDWQPVFARTFLSCERTVSRETRCSAAISLTERPSRIRLATVASARVKS